MKKPTDMSKLMVLSSECNPEPCSIICTKNLEIFLSMVQFPNYVKKKKSNEISFIFNGEKKTKK